MPSTKCKGLSYLTLFLKRRDSVIKIIVLNTELNKPHFLRDEMIFMHCSPQIKQNIFNRHFRGYCSDTIYSKNIEKNRKKSHFLKFIISILVKIFRK